MKLADKTILNILAKSCNAFLLLLSSVVMVRHFAKNDYGTFLQIMLIVNTTMLLGLLGVPQSIYYFYHRTVNQAGFIAQTVMISLALGLACALIIYFMMDVFALWLNNPDITNYAYVASAMIFFRGASQFREPLLISEGSLVLNSWLTVICGLFFYLPVIIGPFFLNMISVLIKLMSIGCAVEFLIYMITSWKLFMSKKGIYQHDKLEVSDHRKPSLKEQLLYALPIGASSYLGVIGKQIDQYLVSAFFLPTDFAVYSRGALRIPVLNNFQFTINSILMPQYVNAYSSGNIGSFLGIFHRSIKKVAKIKYPAFAFLFALAPSLITLLYTNAYANAIPILQAYLILLLTTVTVYGIVPRASGKTLCITCATVISIFGNIAISLLLLPKFGPLGAALGTVLSSILGGLYLLVQSCKILGISFKDIFPWKYLGKLLLISLTASLPLYLIQYTIEVQGMKLLALLGLEAISYSYICLLLMMKYMLISIDDVEILSRWLRIDLKVWLPRVTFCRYFDQK